MSTYSHKLESGSGRRRSQSTRSGAGIREGLARLAGRGVGVSETTPRTACAAPAYVDHAHELPALLRSQGYPFATIPESSIASSGETPSTAASFANTWERETMSRP